MSSNHQPYLYTWPRTDLSVLPEWSRSELQGYPSRRMPESRAELARDSAWPAFFPSPMCLVTVRSGGKVALEKVVGASIVNRFPYILALSFCRESLSKRHHARSFFTSMIEESRAVAVQFLPPGPNLDRAMSAILDVPEERTMDRIGRTGLRCRDADTNSAPVFDESYLIYEARLVGPGKDFCGDAIFPAPWIDVGSHRVYFFEINAIQLREDIAEGKSQIFWRSLPTWRRKAGERDPRVGSADLSGKAEYVKGYNPLYAFPSKNTVAFQWDQKKNGRALLHLAPLATDQVQVDNDKARWPCFFPSSAGIIGTWGEPGIPNAMPCGSTTILSRHPLVIAPCVSYAPINVRYAPRASLDIIRRAKHFSCGVPFIDEGVLQAVRYTGNVSFRQERDKVARSGFGVMAEDDVPVFSDLPVNFKCRVIGEVKLGTHVMFLGEVERIFLHPELSHQQPLEWNPWAELRSP